MVAKGFWGLSPTRKAALARRATPLRMVELAQRRLWTQRSPTAPEGALGETTPMLIFVARLIKGVPTVCRLPPDPSRGMLTVPQVFRQVTAAALNWMLYW